MDTRELRQVLGRSRWIRRRALWNGSTATSGSRKAGTEPPAPV